MGYVPSVLVGIDDWGKKIIQALKEYLDEKYTNINIFSENSITETDLLCNKVKQIRGRHREEIEFAQTPLFNLIIIAEKIYQDGIKLPSDEYIRKVQIVKDINNCINIDSTVYFFSNETNIKQRIEDTEINNKIINFLLILLCSKIYEERDYGSIFFPERTVLSLGLEIVSPDTKALKEYLEEKFIEEFLNEFNKTECENITKNEREKLKEECKDWLEENCKLKEQFDLNKIMIHSPNLAPSLPFFTTGEFRKRKIQDYHKSALAKIREYLMNKKEKAKELRIEIENRLEEKLKNISGTRIGFLKNLVEKAPDDKLRKVLKETASKNDEILGICELLNQKKESLNWTTLSGYGQMNFPQNAPHPIWLIMLMLFLIAFIPTIVELIFPQISLFLYLKWTIYLSLPLIFYILFSVWSLLTKRNQIITEWLNQLKLVNNFFAENFNKKHNSVQNFYEIWYLSHLKTFLYLRMPEINTLLNKLDKLKEENSTRLSKNTLESEYKKKLEEIKIEPEFKDFKAFLHSSLDGKDPIEYLKTKASGFSNEKLNAAQYLILSVEKIKEKIKQMIPTLLNGSMVIHSGKFETTDQKKVIFYSQPEVDVIIEYKNNRDLLQIEMDYPCFYGVMQLKGVKIDERF